MKRKNHFLSFKVSFVKIGSADWKLPGDNRKTDNRNIILEIEKAMKTNHFNGVFQMLSNNLFQAIFPTHSSVCNSLWALRK